MTQSMTGFATQQGQSDTAVWTWDIRSVNARGLDLRLRLPDGTAALEAEVRKRLTARLTRGNVSLSLKVSRSAALSAARVDPDMLDAVLDALEAVQNRAMERGHALRQATAADVLSHRGVLGSDDDGGVAWPTDAMLADFDTALEGLLAMRADEGAKLKTIIADQIDQIAALTDAARDQLDTRAGEQRAALAEALAKVTASGVEVDEGRLAQELALIAVKSDVTEEIDRLGAHVAAARDLLADTAAVGRRFDFLAQEFNREANTLCAKAGSPALTRIGLDLKTVIDQMREQIQNVE